MKFNDIIQKPTTRKVLILNQKQIQKLAISLVSLMEQEQTTKTYILRKNPNGGKQFK